MKTDFDYEKIKYVKLEYKNSADSVCAIKLSLRNILDKNIILCCENNNNINVKFPEKICLKFVCNDGLYIAYTELTEFRSGDAVCYFTVQKPLKYDYQQNREYFRVNTSVSCLVKVPKNNKFEVISIKSNNISANGISLILPFEYTNELLNLTLMLENAEVHTLIRYIRSEKVKNGYLVSFKYENISPKDRDAIVKFCIKQQLLERKSR